MAEILCVGANDALTKTRCVILEHVGHVVRPAHDLREVIAACKGKEFAVAVLSQILPSAEKQRINGVIREHCPAAKILELHNAITPDLPAAHGHLRVATSEPEGLEKAVNALTDKADGEKSKPQKRSGASQG